MRNYDDTYGNLPADWRELIRWALVTMGLVLMLEQFRPWSRVQQASEVMEEDRSSCGDYRRDYRVIVHAETGRTADVRSEEARMVLAAAVDCATSQLNDVSRQKFNHARQTYLRDAYTLKDAAETAVIDLELLGSLKRAAAIEEQKKIAAIIAIRLGVERPERVAERRGAITALRASGWRPPAGFDDVLRMRQEYLENCRQRGVPIPPRLGLQGDGSGLWSGPMEIEDKEDLFIMRDRKTVAWTYSSQSGFCIALGRSDDGDEAAGRDSFQSAFVGTICTNNAQSDACFFDNYTYDARGNVRELNFAETLATEYRDLVHPQDIKNTCQDCHIGMNPFLVNPRQRIASAISRVASPVAEDTWFSYVPFGGEPEKQWHNTRRIAVAADQKRASRTGACMMCHSLPDPRMSITGKADFRDRYCNPIMKISARELMPPATSGDPHATAMPAGWPDGTQGTLNKDYRRSVMLLYGLCNSRR